MTRRRYLLTVSTAGVVGLAGCGQNDGTDDAKTAANDDSADDGGPSPADEDDDDDDDEVAERDGRQTDRNEATETGGNPDDGGETTATEENAADGGETAESGDDGEAAGNQDEEENEDSTDESGGIVMPIAQFTFEHSSNGNTGSGTLKITHDGGDAIQAAELSVRGSGFGSSGQSNGTASTSSAVTNAGTTWQEAVDTGAATATGTKNGETAVVSGDQLTAAVSADYKIRVVWESSEGKSSATLGSDTGSQAKTSTP